MSIDRTNTRGDQADTGGRDTTVSEQVVAAYQDGLAAGAADFGRALLPLVQWLEESCSYWQIRAKVPPLEGDERLSEVRSAFDTRPEVVAAYESLMALDYGESEGQ